MTAKTGEGKPTLAERCIAEFGNGFEGGERGRCILANGHKGLHRLEASSTATAAPSELAAKLDEWEGRLMDWANNAEIAPSSKKFLTELFILAADIRKTESRLQWTPKLDTPTVSLKENVVADRLYLSELAENLDGDVLELSHAVPFYDSINESETAKALRDVKDVAHKLALLSKPEQAEGAK